MFPQNRRRSVKKTVDAALHAAQTHLVGEDQMSFQLLLRHIRPRTSLLSTASEPLKQGTGEVILAGLVEIARRRGGWLRPIHKWLPPQASQFVQFRSLVNHLFARYMVPNFMASVWLRPRPEAASWLALFLHLGRGKSIRQFDTPIRLTKRMARYFMLAPDDLSVEQALRWAQVRGLGGKAKLARTVVDTWLRVPTTDEPFCKTLIEFLVSNWPMSLDEVRQIIQFVHDQRFQPAETTWGLGAGPEPLQPDFVVRGLSLRSIRRRMAHWREEVIRMNPTLVVQSDTIWPATDIGSFRYDDGDVLWTVEELLSGKALKVDGGIMDHCVATYIHACFRRWTSIWSLKAHEGERSRRILTIQVSPRTRRILQAKGRKNVAPDEQSWLVLKQWANQERLALTSTVKRRGE
ncbi:MAG TPA: PcfJ domain-containing protein [Lacipirellulaceae bacterium]|nr:PcfJ domain-containing protein [Lacipirellulaceae bacterium]